MSSSSINKSAFVVVDMQNDYCHPEGTYPRNGLKCTSLELVVPAIVSFSERSRKSGIPIIHLRMMWNEDASGYPIDAGLIVEQSRPFLNKEGLRRGTWGSDDLAELPKPDYVIEKARYSGFYNTSLDSLLRGLAVDHLYLAGVITNVCVEATARDAFHRDFRFTVLSDCVSAFRDDLHAASLETMRIFGRIAHSAEIDIA